MSAQFARAPHQGRPAVATHNAPNAALLIDFDNVTMGIRSDLSKELKKLLSSDIIKGKVAVQRAYADWRRYPQYIVPLAEAAVDLIFAPAYGSSKKNATDIRLAIDALELVFIRPEIGVFILLSGDSDFSSLVLKLKEYGKYVIGVGIRESTSDLLVQNCDEYYSYSALSGLTRAGDEENLPSEDPWVLVERAVRHMASHNEVMRSDRLKQVMLDLDPNFDERELGYSKFSKFLADAASRDRLVLKKLENGQFEVAPPPVDPEPSAEAVAAAPAAPVAPARSEERRPRGEDRRSRSERGERGDRAERARTPAAKEPAAPVVATPASEAAPADPLSAAYGLLQRALADLTRGGAGSARDSDVKRRMLELEPGWDEATVGFSKFSRFLRQAHDAEVIDLRKMENGAYEVVPANGRERAGHAEQRATASEADRRTSRQARGRSERSAEARAAERVTAKPAVEAAPAPEAVEAAEPEPVKAEEPVAARAEEPAAKADEPAPKAAEPDVEEPAADTEALATSATTGAGVGAVPGVLRFRRGTRGRARSYDSPPPLLEGQAIAKVGELNGAAAQVSETTASPEPEPAEPAAVAAVPESPAAAAAEAATPAESARPARKKKSGAARRKARQAKAAALSLADLDLPVEPRGIVAYITRYEGVGRRTAETLIEAFGVDGVFPALHGEPDRVREVLGGRRAELLLGAWHAEHQARLESPAEAVEAVPAPKADGAGRREPAKAGKSAAEPAAKPSRPEPEAAAAVAVQPVAAEAEAVKADDSPAEADAPVAEAAAEPAKTSRSRSRSRSRSKKTRPDASASEAKSAAAEPVAEGPQPPAAEAAPTDSAAEADQPRTGSRRGGRRGGRKRKATPAES